MQEMQETQAGSLGRSPGGGNGNPLQYSCLENPRDGGAWRATSPCSCKESDTTEQLSTHTFILYKNSKNQPTGGTCNDTCLLFLGHFLALPFTQEMHIFPVAGGLSPLGLGSFPLSTFLPMSVPFQSHSGASATSAWLEEGSLAQGQSG